MLPPSPEAGATEARLSALLAARGVRDFAFRHVPANYYDRPLEERRGLLRADSVAQVNTQATADVVDCSNPKNSKYYVVVVQFQVAVEKRWSEKLKVVVVKRWQASFRIRTSLLNLLRSLNKQRTCLAARCSVDSEGDHADGKEDQEAHQGDQQDVLEKKIEDGGLHCSVRPQ
ncbi:uncharacterized protein LOC101766494 isoform X2 [Setaria italica]|uniref:uncharacterized protein LOC101766494 isoform X2 n=1 Tax=Setaria italica TaxID=4555 RepID=UPI000350BCBA|nr:uncharacterized protein LOC101766494 isoform X2 [Setaria italica]